MEKLPRGEQTSAEIDTFMKWLPWVTRYTQARYRLNVTGLEDIPDGPVMFAANHVRFDDTLIIMQLLANYRKRPVRAAAKLGYFEGKGINDKGLVGRTIQKLVEDTRQIPVDRENSETAAFMMAREFRDVFQNRKEDAVIHWEGTRPKDGLIYDAQAGPVRFAMQNKASLVPVAIDYEKHRIGRTEANVTFLPALIPPDYGIAYSHHFYLPNSLADALGRRALKPAEHAAMISENMVESVAQLLGRERSHELINFDDRQDVRRVAEQKGLELL